MIRTIMSATSTSARPKVFVTRTVPPAALDILRDSGLNDDLFNVVFWDDQNFFNDPFSFSNFVVDADAVLFAVGCRGQLRCDEEFLNKAGPNLKVIATMSVGYDHIDVAACRKRGIKLGYTPGVLTETTAELTIALMLVTTRRMIEANKAIFSGEWGAWSAMWMCGSSIADSTVGIFGLGRIGLSVGRKLIPFKPKQILYNSRSRSENDVEIGAKFVDFETLLCQCDFVLVTCAATPETQFKFNKEAFEKMKTSAVFINTSRGALVDQDALYDALTSGQIRAAGLDVTTPEPLAVDHKLLTLPNCVIMPHIGSSTVECRESMAKLTAQNIIAALEGREMPCEIP